MSDLVQIPFEFSAPVNNIVLMGKLSELMYEESYVRRLSHPVVTSTTFCSPNSSPTDQFLHFASLCAWILGECGDRNLAGHTFTDFDEPTSIVADLISSAKKYVDVHDLYPNKLKTGYGNSVCAFLVALCRAALNRRTVLTGSVRTPILTWASASQNATEAQLKMVQQKRVNNMLLTMEDERSLYDVTTLEGTAQNRDGNDLFVEDGVLRGGSDKSKDEVKNSGNGIANLSNKDGGAAKSQSLKSGSAFVPVDPREWYKEVKAVEPALKNAIYDLTTHSFPVGQAGSAKTDMALNGTNAQESGEAGGDSTNEWIKHLCVLVGLANRIQRDATGIEQPLNIILTNFQQQVSRIADREKLLNKQISPSSNGLLQVATKHSLKMEEAKYLKDKITEITETLAKVSEDLNVAKQQLSTEASKMSDMSPMLRVKQAIISLTSEIRQLDLKIALAQQKLFTDNTQSTV